MNTRGHPIRRRGRSAAAAADQRPHRRSKDACFDQGRQLEDGDGPLKDEHELAQHALQMLQRNFVRALHPSATFDGRVSVGPTAKHAKPAAEVQLCNDRHIMQGQLAL